MAGNNIYVQGSYIDVHDNENVYLNVDKAEVKVRDEVQKSDGAAEEPHPQSEKGTEEERVLPDELSTPEVKPTADFASLVTKPERARMVVRRIHELIAGQKKPKDVMMPIRAAMEAGALKRPTWNQFRTEFGEDVISNKSSFSDYTNTMRLPYLNNDFEFIKDEFKRLISE